MIPSASRSPVRSRAVRRPLGQAGGQGLAGLVGPAEPEAVALAVEDRAAHGRPRERRTSLGAVETGALGQHAVDLGLHRAGHPPATDGAGCGGGLGGRRDRAVVVAAVGQEGHGAEGQRERGRGDGDGVPPERARVVTAGDLVGEEAGKGRHGEDLDPRTTDAPLSSVAPEVASLTSAPLPTGTKCPVGGWDGTKCPLGGWDGDEVPGRRRLGADDEIRTRDIDGGQSVARGAPFPPVNSGADDEIRTRDIDLGKVALYQLSYIRSAVRGRRAERYRTGATARSTGSGASRRRCRPRSGR